MTEAEGAGTNITLSDAILACIRKSQLGMFVHLPGVVTSFDPKTLTASIQPAIDRKLDDGSLIKLPTLDDVPVLFPRAQAGALVFPLAEGDHVLLCFSQRSLDKWKDQGSGFAPIDNRLFDISDAIAIPGCFPPSKPLDPVPEGFELRATENLKLTVGKVLTVEAKEDLSWKAKKVIIEGTEQVDLKSPKVNLGDSPDEPGVLGNKLKKNLEDLIQAVNDLCALITAGQPIGSGSGSIVSTIVTAPVEASLAAVKGALETENSTVVTLK